MHKALKVSKKCLLDRSKKKIYTLWMLIKKDSVEKKTKDIKTYIRIIKTQEFCLHYVFLISWSGVNALSNYNKQLWISSEYIYLTNRHFTFENDTVLDKK